MITTFTSRELNQDITKAKREALKGPVFITDRGKPAHVLLSYQEYQNLTGKSTSIVDVLAMPENIDIEFEPENINLGLKPADFS